MSACDTLRNFISSLQPAVQDLLKHHIKSEEEEMLAARSEDARVRLVQDFMQEVRESLQSNR